MKKLLILGAGLTLLLLALLGLGLTETGLRLLVRGGEMLLADSFGVEKVSGRLLSAWQLDNVRLSLPSAGVRIGRLKMAWQAGDLGRGRLHIVELAATDLDVRLSGQQEKDQGGKFTMPKIVGLPSLALDRFTLDRLRLIDDRDRPITAISHLAFGLAVDRRQIALSDATFAADDFGGQVHGLVRLEPEGNVELLGSWRYAGAGFSPLQGTFSALGPLADTVVAVGLTQPGQIRLEGRIKDLLAKAQWQARLSIGRIRLAEIHPDWPALAFTLQGDLAGDLNSYGGRLTGSGSLADSAEMAAAVDLAGDAGEVRISALSLNGKMGRAEIADGLLSWREGLHWKGKIAVKEFDPAFFAQDYPGEINLQAEIDGGRQKDQLSGSLVIDQLVGQLRGYPLTGSGSLQLAGQDLTLSKISLGSGGSTLKADGRISDTLDLQLSLATTDLGEVLADGRGRLALDAKIGGSREVPAVEATLSAGDLAYQDVALSDLTAKVKGTVLAGSPVDGSLTARGLRYGQVLIDQLSFLAKGSADQHTLQLRLAAAQGNLALQASGKLADGGWQGQLHDTKAELGRHGQWLQQGRAGVDLTAAAIALSGLCLQADQGRLCADGGWQSKDHQWQLKAGLSGLELGQLAYLLPLPGGLAGRAEAALTAAGDGSAVRSAKVNLSVDEARIGTISDIPGWQQLEIATSALDLQLDGGRLSGRLSGTVNKGSRVELSASAEQVGSFTAALTELPIQGNLQLALADLDFVGPLSGYTVRPFGRAEGNLRLTGTLGRPELVGDLSLPAGKIDLPTFGISITEFTAAVTASPSLLQIDARAVSGPGDLQATGLLDFAAADGLSGDFRLTGTNADLFVLPEYAIRVDPDVRITFSPKAGSLTGHVLVPYALLTPEQMKSSLKLSDDVVFLDADQITPVEKWQLTTALKVKLGEDVKLDGYGLTGYLHGEIDVLSTPGSFMTGKGQLSLAEGKFSIYGRSLDIVRGRILFADGPIDDPGVDVRAQKTVAGDNVGSADRKVGVDVTGTAKDLEFKLFAEPYLEESDILAYLVVGRSMSDTSGQEESILKSAATLLGIEKTAGVVDGLTSLLPVDEIDLEGSSEGDDMSLVVGKRLTEDLFIGYDHNFFDQKGEFKMRYNLGYGFAVETRSSGSVTGADIYYSFEN